MSSYRQTSHMCQQCYQKKLFDASSSICDDCNTSSRFNGNPQSSEEYKRSYYSPGNSRIPEEQKRSIFNHHTHEERPYASSSNNHYSYPYNHADSYPFASSSQPLNNDSPPYLSQASSHPSNPINRDQNPQNFYTHNPTLRSENLNKERKSQERERLAKEKKYNYSQAGRNNQGANNQRVNRPEPQNRAGQAHPGPGNTNRINRNHGATHPFHPSNGRSGGPPAGRNSNQSNRRNGNNSSNRPNQNEPRQPEPHNSHPMPNFANDEEFNDYYFNDRSPTSQEELEYFDPNLPNMDECVDMIQNFFGYPINRPSGDRFYDFFQHGFSAPEQPRGFNAFFQPNPNQRAPDLSGLVNGFFGMPHMSINNHNERRQRNLFGMLFNDFENLPNFDYTPVENLFYRASQSPLDFGDIFSRLAGMRPQGQQPADRSRVNTLQLVTLTPEIIKNNSTCTVCQEDFKAGEKAKKLKCDHYFHEPCIMPWLDVQNNCPVCRKPI